VPEPAKLEKAELRELDSEFKTEINEDAWMVVQLNPESLKVSFANQIQQPSGSGDQRGTPARQFVGAGTTKLSMTLWFDVNAPLPAGQAAVDDVRKLTGKIAYFITPKPAANGDKGQLVPPAVRFVWGSFQFDGLMDSLEENIELFSPEGRPLRAGLGAALSQQKITQWTFRDAAAAPPGAPARGAGAVPLAQAPAGSTVQGLTGGGGDWQRVAAANGIENPRAIEPGRLLDLAAREARR
jgi:hypothetical protein